MSQAKVQDVAEFILKKKGPMTAMKLQKLCYYAQAWSLVWDERPLFAETFQAWANGPVCPELYELHRGQFTVTTVNGNAEAVTDLDSIGTINIIVDRYGKMSAQELSDLTHSEQPWMSARRGIPEGVRSSNPITEAAMAEYYGSLTKDSDEV